MTEDAGSGQGDTGAGEGGEQTSFLDGISDEGLRGNEALGGFESLDDFAQSYVDLKGSQPTIPENTDDYAFDVPEGVQIDEAGTNAFKNAALEAGLTPEQYKQVVGFRYAEIASVNQAVEKARETALEELKADPDFGGENLQANLEKAQKLLAKYDSVDILAEDAGMITDINGVDGLLGNKTGLFRFLVKVANDFSEDHFETGGGRLSGDKRQMDEAGKPVFDFKDM